MSTVVERLKKQQQAAEDRDRTPHILVEALAGTGKSTTILLGTVALTGGDPTLLPPRNPGEAGRKIIPSPQQEAIWDALCLSKGLVRSVHLISFNKAIAEHLQETIRRLGLSPWVTASTTHSMGFKAVQNAYGSCGVPIKVNSYRVQDIISELLEKDVRELRRQKPALIEATEKLVGLCKQTLALGTDCYVGITYPRGNEKLEEFPPICSELEELAAYYDLDLNGDDREIFDLVPRVLERCKDVARDGCVDFNDMIWLPIALDLPVPQYDILMVDEAQDLNRCQQELALRVGKRLVFVGDPHQAIYGFAGADADSIARLRDRLSKTERGCVVLPLTVTRRCGKAIVDKAREYVPEFKAAVEAREGIISYGFWDSKNQPYQARVEDGDMILCRVNAPLVSECFQFLRDGRKANIQGRDVGQGLISTIRRLKATGVVDLIEKLSTWLHQEQRKELAKRNPNPQRLTGLQDRHDCILTFCAEQNTIEALVQRIEGIFTDDRSGEGIKLSSIHKAKGLEAYRVFLIQPKGAEIPHPMAKTQWQREQEYNLLYVAITRAINELVFVA